MTPHRPLLAPSDDLFEELKEKLVERTRDKEALVRTQAVIALSKFQVGYWRMLANDVRV